MKISDFVDGPNVEPEPETTPESPPSPADMATIVAYGTELMVMAIHMASDKIAAAVLATKMTEMTERTHYSDSELVTLRDNLFQGYNTMVAALQPPEQGETDGEVQEKDSEQG